MTTGVLTPVVSMSMRALIGMDHVFATPGSWRAAFICSTNCSFDKWSGLNGRKMPCTHWGAFESQVLILGQSRSGFKTTTVSIIEKGAGSVDVSARPDLP